MRIRLPDRPGELAKVARVLGAAGADITQVHVLEREVGTAIDDFVVSWPVAVPNERLRDAVSGLPAVRLLGLWPTVEPYGAFPDAEVLGQLATAPERGMETLVDAVPGIISADWAAMVRQAQTIAVSWRTPDWFRPPELLPARPQIFTAGDRTRFASVPMTAGEDNGMVLLVARREPEFHPTELQRITGLVVAAREIIGAALPARAAT